MIADQSRVFPRGARNRLGAQPVACRMRRHGALDAQAAEPVKATNQPSTADPALDSWKALHTTVKASYEHVNIQQSESRTAMNAGRHHKLRCHRSHWRTYA